jgi:hypothetical protein
MNTISSLVGRWDSEYIYQGFRDSDQIITWRRAAVSLIGAVNGVFGIGNQTSDSDEL